MKIYKIRISNFRSIEDAEILPDQFNVFVGQNNHGKTNLFEAVEWFYRGLKKGSSIEELKFCQNPNLKLEVEIEFRDVQVGLKRMRNEKNKKTLEGKLNNGDSITIKRTCEDPKKRKININGEWLEKNPTGFDSALNDLLPRFEYINTRTCFEDVGKFSVRNSKTPMGIMLSEVLTAILEENDDYKTFRNTFDKLFEGDDSQIKVKLDQLSNSVQFYLEKQFPDCTKVKLEIAPPHFEDLLKNYETVIDDGVSTSVAEKGDGMQRATMLAILQAYVDFRKEREEIGKTFLFFIDEAELHLHPSAQRKLKNSLIDISSGEDQVFINTHSSVLISDKEDNQKIIKVEKNDKKTSFTPIVEKEKGFVIYDLLGGSPADLLFPNNFLIVEGRSDFIFIEVIIKRFYPDNFMPQIVFSEGDFETQVRSFDAIGKLFSPLNLTGIYKDRVIILCDKPSGKREANFIDFKKSYPDLEKNTQLFVLNNCSLEEYYPNPWKVDKEKVSNMSSEQKINLARKVSLNITKESFEKEMVAIYNALEECWGKGWK